MGMKKCKEECIAKSSGCIQLFFWFAKATISHADVSGNVGHGRASHCLPYASEISHIESRSSYDRSACIRFLAMLMTYIRHWTDIRVYSTYASWAYERDGVAYFVESRFAQGLLTYIPYALSPNGEIDYVIPWRILRLGKSKNDRCTELQTKPINPHSSTYRLQRTIFFSLSGSPTILHQEWILDKLPLSRTT